MSGAIGPVEAVGGARAPLATLQALAAAVADLAQQPSNGSGPGAGAAGLSLGTPAAMSLPDLLPSTVATAQAVQGRLLLGELAAESTAQRGAPTPFGAEVLRATLQPAMGAEGASAPRLLDVVSTPVLLNPLHPPAGTPVRPRQVKTARPRGAAQPLASPPLDDGEAQAQPEPQADDHCEPAATPQMEAWRQFLQRGEQTAALRELALRRAVLLVLPQAAAGGGPVPARAWLLRGARATVFAARWWPGAGQVARDDWLSWRVFRDGAPMLENGLRSRHGVSSCRIRLGPQAPRLSDAEAAGLHLVDRLRFAHGLGAQWSLLLLVAPPGQER